MQLRARMRFIAGSIIIACWAGTASGALISSAGPSSSGGPLPSIQAAQGALAYQYNGGSQTGLLTLNNVPNLASIGSGSGSQASVQKDSTGTLQQLLSAVLDPSGNLVTSPANQYQLRGQITVSGQTYDGVLLNGHVVSVGAQALDSVGVNDTDIFDAKVSVDGGLLSAAFGPTLYLRFMPTVGSTFTGRFDTDFSGSQVITSAEPFPVPEPLSIAFFGLALIWAWKRGRSGRARAL